jgi:hypothetical protein
MSSPRPTFIYSTIEDHVAATALLKLRYGAQQSQQQPQQQSQQQSHSQPIAWSRTMRAAAIDARQKIHVQSAAMTTR